MWPISTSREPARRGIIVAVVAAQMLAPPSIAAQAAQPPAEKAKPTVESVRSSPRTAQPTPQSAQPTTRSAQPTDALRARAERGEAAAQFDIGVELMRSRDQARLAEARRWLRLAMDGGHVEAKNAYGGLLINGVGGPRDVVTGLRLVHEAAAQGSVGANMTLSEAYASGTGSLARDPRRAFAHMQAAAARAQGRSVGMIQWRLGMMHLQGVGTPVDEREAYRWVARASETGSVDAMISRGVMLATGQGVAKDEVAARTWYERAARSGQQGWAHALRALGGMMVLGQGGQVDLPRGLAYLMIASSGGDERAQVLVQALRARITPAIEREAQAIVRQWPAAR